MTYRGLLTTLATLLVLTGPIGAQSSGGSPEVRPALSPEGFWIVKVGVDDRGQVDALNRRVDVWRIFHDRGYVEAALSPAEYDELAAEGYELEIDAAGTRALDRLGVPLDKQFAGIPGFPCYRTVEETYATAEAIVAAHPDLATWTDVGDSWEKTQDSQAGWDLFVLKLTQSAVPGPKPVFFAHFAIHAREYTTAELGTRFAEMLADGYGVDPDVTWLLDHHEVHLVLQANPDGRKQAETGLSWRKNTNNAYCSNTNTRGADLNRNFEFEWGCCGGSSGSQCSTTYRGPAAGSEPEIQALQAYAASIFPDQRGPGQNDPAPADATGVALDIHSSGELVLWPWGFTATPSPNATAFATLGRKLAFFNGHTPMVTQNFTTVDGDSLDHYYGELGVAGLAYELGTQFFEDCSFFEANVLPGNLESLLYAAKVARTPFLTPAGPEALGAAVSPSTTSPGGLVLLTATVDDTRFNQSNGTEPTQTIAAAEAFVGLPPWEAGAVPLAMAASDGTFDESVEDVEVTIDTAGLAPGRHLLFVRGLDTAGNAGVVAAAFLDVAGPCAVDADCDDGAFCNGTETCDAGVCRTGTAPCGAGGICREAGDLCCSESVDFEGGAAGWTNSGASTCTTGSFVVATPTLQTNGGVTTQVGGDHTSGSGNAFFSATNTSAGSNDVDGGVCIVESPVYPAAQASDVSIWYFHGQRDAGDDSGDFFLLEISTDGGASYAPMVSIGDVTSNAAWTEATAGVPAGSDVRFRVQVSDGTAGGDLVEGGVDDLLICSAPPGGCSVDADCDDGLFCNGAETCDVPSGTCQAGTAPDCDDGVACTADACNETADSCDNVPDDGLCDDGLFCNGAETCDAVLDCRAGSDPCAAGELCDETGDFCIPVEGCSYSADFEAGAAGWTAGADTCTTGTFLLGTPDATAWQVGGGNPGQAFFTQNNPGGIGADDVDGGTCEALSPVVDCRGDAAVEVRLDYFHGQRDAGDDAGDGFTVEVLNDGVVVDTLVAIGDVTNNPAWTTVSATVADPGNLQIRVRATDAAGGGDIVEAGIDNVSILVTEPQTCTYQEGFESGMAGWTNGASTCATGDYVAGDPTNPGGGQQIVGSHTGSGSIFTAVNTGAGTADVDGGNCILDSPALPSPAAAASTLSVWYWHGQRDDADDPNGGPTAGDGFLLEVSTDGGATWSTLASNGDSSSAAAWTEATAAIPAGSDVRLRMQCSDGASAGDLVECGIDDVSICR